MVITPKVWFVLIMGVCIFIGFNLMSLNAENRTDVVDDNRTDVVDELRKQVIFWRRAAGELSCKANPDATGPTGGWCLHPDNSDWGNLGRSAVHHVVADSGIGNSLVKYLTVPNRRVSLLDIGAGVGQYGYWLKANNASIDWYGYDGAENIESFTDGFVKWIDVTDPIFDTIDFRADWVMSLEIGEHIPPEATDNLIDLLDRHNRHGVILSWAVPGQDGHSHINTRTNDDISSRLFKKGYIVDEWSTAFQQEVRQTAVYWWFHGSFMVFKRPNPV